MAVNIYYSPKSGWRPKNDPGGIVVYTTRRGRTTGKVSGSDIIVPAGIRPAASLPGGTGSVATEIAKQVRQITSSQKLSAGIAGAGISTSQGTPTPSISEERISQPQQTSTKSRIQNILSRVGTRNVIAPIIAPIIAPRVKKAKERVVKEIRGIKEFVRESPGTIKITETISKVGKPVEEKAQAVIDKGILSTIIEPIAKVADIIRAKIIEPIEKFAEPYQEKFGKIAEKEIRGATIARPFVEIEDQRQLEIKFERELRNQDSLFNKSLNKINTHQQSIDNLKLNIPNLKKINELSNEFNNPNLTEAQKENIFNRYIKFSEENAVAIEKEMEQMTKYNKIVVDVEKEIKNIKDLGYTPEELNGQITFKNIKFEKQAKNLRPNFLGKTISESFIKNYERKFLKGTKTAFTDLWAGAPSIFKKPTDSKLPVTPPIYEPLRVVTGFVPGTPAKSLGSITTTGIDLGFYSVPVVGALKWFGPTVEKTVTGELRQFAKEEPFDVAFAGGAALFKAAKITKGIIKPKTPKVIRRIAVGDTSQKITAIQFKEPKKGSFIMQIEIPSKSFIDVTPKLERLYKIPKSGFVPSISKTIKGKEILSAKLQPKFSVYNPLTQQFSKTPGIVPISGTAGRIRTFGARTVSPLKITKTGKATGILERFEKGKEGRIRELKFPFTGRSTIIESKTLKKLRPFEKEPTKKLLKEYIKDVKEVPETIFVSKGYARVTKGLTDKQEAELIKYLLEGGKGLKPLPPKLITSVTKRQEEKLVKYFEELRVSQAEKKLVPLLEPELGTELGKYFEGGRRFPDQAGRYFQSTNVSIAKLREKRFLTPQENRLLKDLESKKGRQVIQSEEILAELENTSKKDIYDVFTGKTIVRDVSKPKGKLTKVKGDVIEEVIFTKDVTSKPFRKKEDEFLRTVDEFVPTKEVPLKTQDVFFPSDKLFYLQLQPLKPVIAPSPVSALSGAEAAILRTIPGQVLIPPLSKVKQISGFGLGVGSSLAGGLRSVLDTKTETIQKPVVITKQLPEVLTKQFSEVVQLPKTVQQTKLVSKLVTKLVTKQVPKVVTKTTVGLSNVQIVKPATIIPKAKIKLAVDTSSASKKKAKQIKKKVISKEGYNALIKPIRKRNYVKANLVPITRNKAMDLGASVSDNSLGAQFKIKKAGKLAKKPKVKIPKGYFEKTKQKFRDFKIRKGKRIPLNNQWIEKRNKRLDTKGEVSKITVLGKIARLQKKFRGGLKIK